MLNLFKVLLFQLWHSTVTSPAGFIENKRAKWKQKLLAFEFFPVRCLCCDIQHSTMLVVTTVFFYIYCWTSFEPRAKQEKEMIVLFPKTLSFLRTQEPELLEKQFLGN